MIDFAFFNCLGCTAHKKFKVVYEEIRDEKGEVVGRVQKSIDLVSVNEQHNHRVNADLHALYAENRVITDEQLLEQVEFAASLGVKAKLLATKLGDDSIYNVAFFDWYDLLRFIFFVFVGEMTGKSVAMKGMKKIPYRPPSLPPLPPPLLHYTHPSVSLILYLLH